MSYDLYFWRQASSVTAKPDELLSQLQDAVSLPGISSFPLTTVKEAFRSHFPDIAIGDGGLDWEGAGSYFQVGFTFLDAHTVTCVSVSCGFKLLDSPDTMNTIIEAVTSLGCALYDPQTGQRYEQPDPTNA
jgi:hypothetical protein